MVAEGFACRETGTRTLVSAVRGRRPRPLDDISLEKRCKITAIFETDKFFENFFSEKIKNDLNIAFFGANRPCG